MASNSDWTAQPAKMYLRNQKTFETITAQANPPEWEESPGKPHWNRAKPPGYSNEVLQYSHSENWKTTLDLESLCANEADVAQIDDHRKLLMSWQLPDVADEISGGSPPRLLFFWPKMVSLIVVITDLKFTHKRFMLDGRPWWRFAKVSIEESRDRRLLASDVRRNGTMRA